MSEVVSTIKGSVARQYDLFQSSLESLNKERKYLNYGYAVSGRETYEERQQRLCLETIHAADIRTTDVIVDVGFGSGEQDFLLARTCTFGRLMGFNISARQVQYANDRAAREQLDGQLSFHLGEAERLPGVAPASVDRMLAIECAFYFDRPRFYARAAEVLKPGGLLVLADIAFADGGGFMARRRSDLRRVSTRSSNRAEWERHFHTRSVRDINRETRPGAQQTVWQILKLAPGSRHMKLAEQSEWMKMAFYSQLVAWGLRTNLLRYDLIVLEKPGR
jgi:cyclopropane fatty-acyl-phospholipid synthase-like methyltransferase